MHVNGYLTTNTCEVLLSKLNSVPPNDTKRSEYDIKFHKISTDNVKKLGNGSWLELQEIEYIDPNAKVTRKWEFCKRKNSSTSAGNKKTVDAVDIHAIIREANMPSQIVLVIQFRPPVGRYCIEFPSGLVDDNETVETTALRELREETGYYGKIKRISEPICYEPGLTDSLTRVVAIEVDPTSIENLNPKQKLEEDEWSLQVIKIPLDNLYNALQTLQQQHSEDLWIDSRLYNYAFALNSAKQYL